MSTVFKALSDPTRRKVLQLLHAGVRPGRAPLCRLEPGAGRSRLYRASAPTAASSSLR
jgi:DNA-binding transcriptional ArsR family regulator